MPGLMSGLFETADSESTSQTETTIDGEGGTGIAASPSIGVEMSGSYEGTDGSNHQWSNSTEAGADFDLDTAIAHSTELGVDSLSDG